MSDAASSARQVDWDRVSVDPDLHGDLDYELVDLDVLDLDTADQVMVLPEEAEMLREDAFVVVRSEDMCDPLEWV